MLLKRYIIVIIIIIIIIIIIVIIIIPIVLEYIHLKTVNIRSKDILGIS